MTKSESYLTSYIFLLSMKLWKLIIYECQKPHCFKYVFMKSKQLTNDGVKTSYTIYIIYIMNITVY